MCRIRLLIGAAMAVVIASGCQAAAFSDHPAPSDAVSAEAESIRARCAVLPEDDATLCFDEALLQVLARDGVRAAMQTLERIGEHEESFIRDGHAYAHSIGLAALGSPEEVGTAFAQCTPLYQSGCYHGVIQAYFVSVAAAGPQALGAPAVNALCEPHRGESGNRWLLFQCAHGMGHGLVMIHDFHLPRALEGCDLLESAWEREACYGGAFMENIVNATVPHHTVGRPDAHGGGHHHGSAAHDAPADHAAHAHHADQTAHAAPAPEPYRALDPADPLYPCNTLEDRYLRACYEMQTSPILFHNRGDVAAAGLVCDGAPEQYRPTCYQSLGRDISGRTRHNDERALAQCSGLNPTYRAWCHVGYAKNVIDVTADPTTGLRYCRAVGDVEGKLACYRAVGQQIWALDVDAAQRTAWCESAEEGYRNLCAWAAGLRREAAAAP
jgi:hypothetical protein